MPPSNAPFVWYELMTGDLQGAETFYRSVVGWSAQGEGTDPPYTLMAVGDAHVAGLMETPAELKAIGRPPCWSGYIAVDDVEGMAARVLQAGGKIHRPGTDIPGVGRFSVVADPQGAVFILFKPQRDEPPPRPAPGAAGTVAWHELMATDWSSAFDFYSTLFGWTKQEAIDMGPLGTYQLFAIDGVPSGGMMTKPADMPGAGWRYYFAVDAIRAAAGRVRDGGGRVTQEPMQVPGGSWVLHGLDPQGAAFALSSMVE